jgi:hypothetical protein
MNKSTFYINLGLKNALDEVISINKSTLNINSDLMENLDQKAKEKKDYIGREDYGFKDFPSAKLGNGILI